MPSNEKELIKRSRAGDSEAFGELYDRHIRTIYNFVYYKTFHKETAEDLTSETFFKALRSISSVDPDRPFLSWLYKVAQNTVLDHFRARRMTEDIDDFWDLSEDDGSGMIDSSDTAREVKKLRKHMKSLSREEREIIIMRVWQELSYKDIGEILGKSEASCKMMYSRSLAKLRTFMPLALLAVFIIHV